jgi:hypothetical protein
MLSMDTLTSTAVAFEARGSAADIAIARSASSASLPLNTARLDLVKHHDVSVCVGLLCQRERGGPR